MHSCRNAILLPFWSVLSAIVLSTSVSPAIQPERVVVAVDRLQADALEPRDAKAQSIATPAGPRLRVLTGHRSQWPAVLFHSGKEPWNLAAYQYATVTVKNVGTSPATVGLRIDSRAADRRKPGPQNRADLKPGEEATIRVRLASRVPPQWREKLVGMRGLPFGWSENSQFDPAQVDEMSVYVTRPSVDHRLEISDIRAVGTSISPPTDVVARLLPMIDRYGQFMHRDWPGKVHNDAELQRHRQQEADVLARDKGPEGWDQYGGWLAGPKFQATGFFRTTKHRERWWLVDPEGRLFWSHGIDCVRSTMGNTPLTGRESWFADLPQRDSPLGQFFGRTTVGPVGYYAGKRVETFNFQAANLFRKFGPEWESQFAAQAHPRLRNWGLNTIGNWSDPKICLLRKTPYVLPIFHASKRLEGSTGYWGKFWDVFDPEYRAALDRNMAKEHGQSAGDPWCIGYFVDNELGWGDELSLAVATLASPAGQAAKRVFLADLRAAYASIEALNHAWGTRHASWDALAECQTPPDKKRAGKDLEAFALKFHRAYFRNCREAVKAVAPHQLYLGCRFAWVNDAAARVSAEYCDVVTYNRYQFTADDFRLPDGIDMPVLIGEFHFGALDRGMFHPGLREVEDQAARAKAYERYLSGALANPWLVGAHWFQYGDEPTVGRWDGENYQIGFVDICDTPYAETIAAARRIGAQLYSLRSAGGSK